MSKEEEFWSTYYPRAKAWVAEFPELFTAQAIKDTFNVDIPPEILDLGMKGIPIFGLPYVQIVTGQLSDYIREPEDNCLVSSWMYRTLKSAPRMDVGYMEDALQGIEGRDEVLPGLKQAIEERALNAKSCFSIKTFLKDYAVECVGEACQR